MNLHLHLTPAELKAVIDYIAQGGEAIAAKTGNPELAAKIAAVQAALDAPAALELATLGLNFVVDRIEAPAKGTKGTPAKGT